MGNIVINNKEYKFDKFEIDSEAITDKVVLAPMNFYPDKNNYYNKCKKCKKKLCEYECYAVGENIVIRTDVYLKIKGLSTYLDYNTTYNIQFGQIVATAILVKSNNTLFENEVELVCTSFGCKVA